MCLIKRRLISSCSSRWNASMKHFDRSFWYLYNQFVAPCRRQRGWEPIMIFFKKKAALLLCTDIAAHGLDFSALHWMIQLDCSEDANAYIHWMNVNTHIRFDEGNHPMYCKKDMQCVHPLSYRSTARYEEGEKAFFRGSWHSKSPSDKSLWLQSRSIPRKWSKFGNVLYPRSRKRNTGLSVVSFASYLQSFHLQSNTKISKYVHQLPITKYPNLHGLWPCNWRLNSWDRRWQGILFLLP